MLDKKSKLFCAVTWLGFMPLKHAMRQRSAWEHDLPASRRQRRYFEKRIDFSTFQTDAAQCLSQEDLAKLKNKHNAATQLLDMQSQHIASLKSKGWIDDYKHVELQRFITDLYAEQGATERIKNTPLPRQYSTSSHLFILIFTFLLPFAMLHEFDKDNGSDVAHATFQPGRVMGILPDGIYRRLQRESI